MDEISYQVVAKVETFSNQDLSNTCWAFAKLEITNSMMMTSLGKQLVTQVETLLPQDLSNTAWAFATLGLPQIDLLDEVLVETIAKIKDFTPQNVANISWAFAKIGMWNDRLMEIVAMEILRKIKDFDGQGLANIAWAFGTLGFKCEKMADAMLHEYLERIQHKEFNTQELANIAFSMDVTGDHERLKKFLDVAITIFQDKDIANYKDGASWENFTNITAQHGKQFDGAETLYNEFLERFYTPVHDTLQELVDPNQGGGHEQAWDTVQQTVKKSDFAGFGHHYSRGAMQGLGIKMAAHGDIPAWMTEFRAIAFEHLKEWRIPGTENIVCIVSYDFSYGDKNLESEPKLFSAGWADGVPEDVKQLIRPIHAHINRDNHCERVALLEVTAGAQKALGEDCLGEMVGWVRMYVTHWVCISCLAAIIQFMRHAPNVTMEVDFDNAWYNCCGEPRPIHEIVPPEDDDSPALDPSGVSPSRLLWGAGSAMPAIQTPAHKPRTRANNDATPKRMQADSRPPRLTRTSSALDDEMEGGDLEKARPSSKAAAKATAKATAKAEGKWPAWLKRPGNTDSSSGLSVGANVELQDMAGRAEELNGQRGKIVEGFGEDRWRIQLDDGESLVCKADNLCLI
eukprot:gnl/MRDRNA2_/MRDRNA2_85161_c0_seq3.p1 gnl/MRDRNA2_/MRDRNA2_85161_c0~~gnl/MRDRNA2_/MRDRNA2_85161_c0_seq3.p1  ORF type:complete len:627 (+),score=126.89 gnl/MRDRNA2_/MRDRNA2_85161_c0_seq3:1-1881(+)